MDANGYGTSKIWGGSTGGKVKSSGYSFVLAPEGQVAEVNSGGTSFSHTYKYFLTPGFEYIIVP